MFKRLKIDSLLVFLIFSNSLLLISWKSGLIILFEENLTDYHEEFDFYKNTDMFYDQDGYLERVGALNPSHSFCFSTDGGDTFNEIGNALNFDQVKNPSITNIPVSWRWKAPHWKIPKIKTVKVFLVNHKSKTRSQLVSLSSLKKINTTLPIMSLCIKQSEFVGDLSGIYSLGKNSWEDEKFSTPWWFRSANFTQRGSKSERKVDFSFYENGKLKLNQTCGIKISGNATRGFAQKSFKIYARKIHGAETFNYSFFGKEGLEEYESLVLRTSGNDNTRTLFADLLIHEIAAESELYIQRGLPTQLFINGNYWGIYNLRERISVFNLAEYTAEKFDKITLLENANAELKDGLKKHYDSFHSLLNEIFSKEKIDDTFLSEISDEINIESFQDYIFYETYFANSDWPDNNAMCFKANKSRWYWILNDLDCSLAYPGVDNVNKNMFDKLYKSNSLFAKLFISLLSNEKFKSDFIKNSRLNIQKFIDERAVLLYEKYQQKIKDVMPQHINRWRSISTLDEWLMHCENNLLFLQKRSGIYLKQLNTL